MIDAVGLALAGMEDPAVDPFFFNEKIWHAVAVHLREENIRLIKALEDIVVNGNAGSSRFRAREALGLVKP